MQEEPERSISPPPVRVDPRTPRPPSKRKVPAGPYTAEKRQRTSGVSSLESIGTSLSDMSDFLRSRYSGNSVSSSGGSALPPSTPQRRRNAIVRAQELESSWLTFSQLSGLIELFEEKVATADTYVVIDNDRLRKCWVRRKLQLPEEFEDL